MCRYYVGLAPDNFRIPSGEGLAEWFEGLLTPPGSEDELKLVCDLDDLVVGSRAGSGSGDPGDLRAKPVSVPFYERGMGYFRGGLSFHKDL